MTDTVNAAARKIGKSKAGRQKGSKNKAPRFKRILTPIQKLREHVLIELSLDKSDIAKGIQQNRQAVNNVFLDIYRSEVEGQVVAFLQSVYRKADLETRVRVSALLGQLQVLDGVAVTDEGEVLTRESLGWPPKAATLTDETKDKVNSVMAKYGPPSARVPFIP